MRKKFIGLTLTGLLVAAAATAQTAPYVRTAIVSPTPGNDLASGTTLINTLAGLTPAPSNTNRWLLKIEPGIYNTGTTPLPMRSWVDIEGSGALETIIRGTAGPTLLGTNFDEISTVKSAPEYHFGVVMGADNAEIRRLTIECISTTEHPSCIGMMNFMASPRVTDVRIRAITPSIGSSHWGMRNFYASPTLDRVDIEAANATNSDNYGVSNVGGSIKYTAVIRNSDIRAYGTGIHNVGIVNRGWAVVNPLTNTNLTATGGGDAYAMWTLESEGDTAPYFIENSRLVATGGTRSSVGIYQDEFMAPIHPVVRGGRVAGDSDGIAISFQSLVEVANSHVSGGTYAVSGGDLKLGATWIEQGTVLGNTEICAGVWTSTFTYLTTTCP